MPNTKYTVNLKDGFAKDANGNLSEAYSFSFTTKGTSAPKIVSTTPANGATGVEKEVAVYMNFNCERYVKGRSHTNTRLTGGHDF